MRIIFTLFIINLNSFREKIKSTLQNELINVLKVFYSCRNVAEFFPFATSLKNCIGVAVRPFAGCLFPPRRFPLLKRTCQRTFSPRPSNLPSTPSKILVQCPFPSYKPINYILSKKFFLRGEWIFRDENYDQSCKSWFNEERIVPIVFTTLKNVYFYALSFVF